MTFFEKRRINLQITPHFRHNELCCKCCDKLIIDDLLYRTMNRIEKIREAVGFRLVINSGHRCVRHNREVGGQPNSWHLRFAADVRPEDPENLTDFCNAILLMNYDHKLFNGVGWYWSFVHLDCRPNPFTWDNRTAKAVKR